GAAQLVARYPAQREALMDGWKLIDEKQRKDEVRAGNEVFAALTNGRPDIAQQRLESRIEAVRAAGGDIAEEERILEMIKADPKQAAGYLSYVLANVDDKFAEYFGKLGAEGRAQEQAPATLAKHEGEASEAGSK